MSFMPAQDFEHDRRVGLNSVPQAFGLDAAFWIARAMHLGCSLPSTGLLPRFWSWPGGYDWDCHCGIAVAL